MTNKKHERTTTGTPSLLSGTFAVFAINIISTYQTSRTVTTPAAGTKSIGLLADAPLSWFLLPIAIGICKNSCQPRPFATAQGRLRRQLIPPVRQTVQKLRDN